MVSVGSLLNIVIISFNCKEHTLNCIKSIKETANIDLLITVVDNNSNDGTCIAIAKEYPEVIIIQNNENLGYSKAVNIGASQCDSEFLIISNADVIYHKNSIDGLVKILQSNREFAAVGPQQIYPNGKWQYSYGYLPSRRLAYKNFFFIPTLERIVRKLSFHISGKGKQFKMPGYLDGAVIAVRKTVFAQLNGFDEDYFFYTEEADFFSRMKSNGFKFLFVPNITVTHFRGASSTNKSINNKFANMFIQSKFLYCKKHLGKVDTLFYAKSEIFNNRAMKWLWSLLKPFCSSRANSRIEYFRILYDTWTCKLKEYKEDIYEEKV